MKASWCNLWCSDEHNETTGDIKLYRNEGIQFNVFDGHNKQVGKFELVLMPGCPGVLVSTSSSYEGPHGYDFHGLKELCAKLLGASAMLATVDVTNIKEIVSASNAGWRMRDAFLHKHGTGNHLAFWVKVIDRVGQELAKAPVPDEYEVPSEYAVPHLD